jgi:hypothetical protein
LKEVLWKCQDCHNCGNPFRIPTIAWKTLRVSHNPLEKLKNSFSTFPQNLKFSNAAYEEKIKNNFSLNAWKIQCCAHEFPTFENLFFFMRNKIYKNN